MTISEFLNRLDAVHISYNLNRVRDALMVEIDVPGERWEVEFMDDGGVEVEIFRSDGVLKDEAVLDVLFERFAD
jgi:hypothetical protein